MQTNCLPNLADSVMDHVKNVANVLKCTYKAQVVFTPCHDVPYSANLAMVSKPCFILILLVSPDYLCSGILLLGIHWFNMKREVNNNTYLLKKYMLRDSVSFGCFFLSFDVPGLFFSLLLDFERPKRRHGPSLLNDWLLGVSVLSYGNKYSWLYA